MKLAMGRKAQTYLVTFLFLIVPLVLLGIFTYYPMIKSVILSFADYNVFTGETAWIGFDNYKWVFDNKYFYIGLRNSFLYLIVVPFIQLFAILTAILVNQKLKGMKFFRTLFYIPVITGAVIVSLSWRHIYDPDGLLNSFLLNLHIIKEPVRWLAEPILNLFAAMFVTFWRGLGYYMVIYMAGLQNIPSELYEAAEIDGASSVQKFWHITLPMLKPTMLFAFLMSTLSALKVFDEIYLLTKGYGDSTTLLYEVYNLAFGSSGTMSYGRSSAISVIMSAILIVFAVINFKFFGKDQTAGEVKKKS